MHYDSVADPCCYPGTTILKNIPNLRDQAALEKFEAAITAQRADEPLPSGNLSVRHYRAIHHHLFQDVYRWAGKFRTVRISKGTSVFCYPENIKNQMRELFSELKRQRYFRNLSRDEFVSRAAHFLATLNAIHPFREGNGRTQTSFLILLAHQAAHSIAIERLDPKRFLGAVIASFHGDEALLYEELRALL
ncbi:MAG TPA: Fic family protein [Stellaceae bacterium]|nr:Fic family protein [Stellaceae bacterium]